MKLTVNEVRRYVDDLGTPHLTAVATIRHLDTSPSEVEILASGGAADRLADLLDLGVTLKTPRRNRRKDDDDGPG